MAPSNIFTHPPKALLTDVFGTVVNWRLTVTTTLSTRASQALNSPTASLPSALRAAASTTDWAAFAQAWRVTYYIFTQTHDPSKKEQYKTVDQHHREALETLCKEHNIHGLWSSEEMDELALVWHFLVPWPDSPRGLGLLNRTFQTATLSNGNVSLLADLAKTGDLPYTHIISAEMFEAYKPNPKVYNGAAAILGLRPDECALVAAHLGDLEAARKCGYRTIYIDRADEEGWGAEKKESARAWVDLWVDGIDVGEGHGGFVEVARRFGISEGAGNGG